MRLRAIHAILGGAIAALVAFGPPAEAHDTASPDGTIQIKAPWTRATSRGATTAAGYVSITAMGPTGDRLVGASLENADKAQIHQMSMDGGIMKMSEVSGGLEIKTGETVTLKPQGYHVMFIGLKEPIVEGKGYWGTLTFEHAGTVRVHFHASAMGASAPAAASGEHKDHATH
jgi:periplasmic copper chaperone A